MKIERTKNASRNVVFGIALKAYQILFPFIMRTAMIRLMGVEYLGLSSLFTSILNVLNLAELGVGSAMVYSMYKPIAEDDRVKICALMRLYKLYYRIIGFVIAGIGLALLPFLPKLVHADLPPDIDLTILYLFYLSATVLSYWLFAYRNALFHAHQRDDVVSKIKIIVDTFKYATQLLVLYLFKNYYAYIIVVLLSQILANITTAIISGRMFPDYKAHGDLDLAEKKEISKRIRDLFTAKLGTVLSTSVDDMVISAFIGLSMLAIYQNYHYIMKAVMGFVLIIFSSCTAGIGNSIVTESADKNYNDFLKLSFLTMWICVVFISCFACMYQPFMALWVGKDLVLPDLMVLLMCAYFFLYVIQHLSCVYKDAAGIWHQDRFRPLIAGIVNLALNISLVHVWGVYAIVLSTIISYLLIAMPWVIKNLFELVFSRAPWEYIIEMIKGALIAAVSGSLCYIIGNWILIDGIAGLLLRFVVAIIVSNTFVLTIRRKNKMFNPTLDLINHISKRKLEKTIYKLKTF